MGSGSSRSGWALRRLRGSGPGGAAPEGGPDPGSAGPPDGGDDDLRLLDQLLAESEAWGPGEPAPPSRRPDACCPVRPGQSAGGHAAASATSATPGSSQRRPETQPAISYSCAEEELMASIEREFCPEASDGAAGGLPPPTRPGPLLPPPAHGPTQS